MARPDFETEVLHALATLKRDNEVLARGVNELQAVLFPLNFNSYTSDDEGKEIEVTLDGFTRMDTIVRANFPLLGEVFAPECLLLRQTALESMREIMHQMTLQQDMLQAIIDGDEEE